MLRWRLLSAAVIVTLFAALVVLDARQALGLPAGAWLFLWLVVIALLGVDETVDLLAAKELRPSKRAVYFGTLLVLWSFAAPMIVTFRDDAWLAVLKAHTEELPLVAFGLAMTLTFLIEMGRFERPAQHVVHAALGIFTIAYVGVLSGFLIKLRLLPGDNGRGLVALLSLIFVVKASDTGAYATGRLLGRTKMTPRLSPGKTYEGAVGGIVAGVVASWLFLQIIAPAIGTTTGMAVPSLIACSVYGVLLSIAGMIGDLTESMLKRDMGRKDSSRWLPGLGGVLDILDSLLVAAPVAYACWAFGLL
jgi:phosphatidate cytidylyltransferase